MAYNIPSFLRKDGDSLVFNQDGEFIFYVPEIYFDRGDALVVGEYVKYNWVLWTMLYLMKRERLMD